MAIKHADEYRDSAFASNLAEKIKNLNTRKIRIMEVCGTHTMSIFRHGIRSLLPDTISLLSGPGCPVCVTAQGEIDAFIELAERRDVIITTFGDLIRVPGSTESSLRKKQAEGCDIRIVYSSLDAIEIAKKNPDKTVVFPGIGFETTAPGTAAAVVTAKKIGLDNFCILSAHKIVPPALFALMEISNTNIDGFLIPGHVSVILGTNAYVPFTDKHKIPCVITGFEPADILIGIHALTKKIHSGDHRPENAYQRAVSAEGNPKARQIMDYVFGPSDAIWRGIGKIPGSGLSLNKEFRHFDAGRRFNISIPEKEILNGCACGKILTGQKTPPDCTLFRKKCTPLNPIGPCMVSSEGTCAAYYKYQ